MRISDWSSDVCSSDLAAIERLQGLAADLDARATRIGDEHDQAHTALAEADRAVAALPDGDATRGAVAALQTGAEARRSEARRGGKACVSTCCSRWTPHHSQKKTNHQKSHQKK